MRGKKNCNVGVITVKRGAFFAWRAQGANAGAERRSAWWFGTWALALMGGVPFCTAGARAAAGRVALRASFFPISLLVECGRCQRCASLELDAPCPPWWMRHQINFWLQTRACHGAANTELKEALQHRLLSTIHVRYQKWSHLVQDKA